MRVAARDRASSPAGRQRIHYDASHIIGFGLQTPVGVARVDNYVAEFLARDPALDIRFLIFDGARGGFRALAADEAALLGRILFNRYEPGGAAPEIIRDAAQRAVLPLALAQIPRPSQEPVTAHTLPGRLRAAAMLSAPAFDRRLTLHAARVLPVTARQSVVRRLAVRIVRRIGLAVARCGHFIVHPMAVAARHAIRPDPPEAVPPAVVLAAPPSAPVGPEHAAAVAPLTPDMIRFASGSVLVSMANAWDYMDYAYLHRICRDDGVRFVCVVYDVIAMQFPFTTPSPPHVYHRHWVEIGHSAAHLLAISQFSVDQYVEFIAEPNDLAPPLSYAYLPSFLRDRADEIGAVPVVSLLGRRFVAFCSTIETRKNHQLLIQLWDRLRLEFGDDQLPVLVFVGKWGWGTETVRLLSERNYRLRNRLLILDRVSDAELIWIYRHARFTLFPSHSEGYGLAAAESLSFGVPVVIADCPALIEATEGLMPAHDPLDFMAWLEEMRSLIRDDVRLDELRAAAARYRGPDYETFADAVRAVACAVAQTAPLPSGRA